MTSLHIWVMGWSFWIVAMLCESWLKFPTGIYGIFCIIVGYFQSRDEQKSGVD